MRHKHMPIMVASSVCECVFISLVIIISSSSPAASRQLCCVRRNFPSSLSLAPIEGAQTPVHIRLAGVTCACWQGVLYSHVMGVDAGGVGGNFLAKAVQTIGLIHRGSNTIQLHWGRISELWIHSYHVYSLIILQMYCWSIGSKMVTNCRLAQAARTYTFNVLLYPCWY